MISSNQNVLTMSVWSCCSEKSSCTVSVFAATLTFSYLFSKQMYCFIVEFYVAVNSSDNYSRSVSIQFCYTGGPVTNEQNYQSGRSTEETMSVTDKTDASIHQQYIFQEEV